MSGDGISGDSSAGAALQRTPLFESHKALGGKLVPFAGWELPVQYTGVIPEHNAVRQVAGLFDVSHMGEIWVTGPNAEAALDRLTCNDVKLLVDGKAQYNALINPTGGVVDDIIIYRFAADRFFVCVNASNTDKDFAWMAQNNPLGATIQNVSAEFGQIAFQGPKAMQLFTQFLGDESVAAVPYFHFCERQWKGAPLIIAHTGYTGEDGVEIFVPADKTVALWDALIAFGKPHGVVPAGLGARDSLRLEACLPLHGHELGDEISAIESGLGWIVKPAKGEFIGSAVLAAQKQSGAPRSLAAFFVEDAGIARHGDKVFSAAGAEIGVVTSGTKTPTVNRALGLALITSDNAALDTRIFIEVRGKRLAAQVTKSPFYKRTKR